MRVGYETIESAVIQRILEVFDVELEPDRVSSGDIDAVFDGIMREETIYEYGAWTDFGGGRQDNQKPFKTPVWIWTIVGFLVIQRSDTIEQKLRSAVTKILGLFDEDHTLGGVTPYIRVVAIGEGQVVNVNDIPFYFLPFTIEAFDRD